VGRSRRGGIYRARSGAGRDGTGAKGRRSVGEKRRGKREERGIVARADMGEEWLEERLAYQRVRRGTVIITREEDRKEERGGNGGARGVSTGLLG
jgi:hypothetical protein